MIRKIDLALAIVVFCTLGFCENAPLIVVNHVDAPTTYPHLARQARIQGTVSIHLKISALGRVLDAQAATEDPSLKAHPILQSQALQLVRNWTFECIGCPNSTGYDHTLVFIYRLEGKEEPYNNSRVTMDLPDTVTIIANPPEINSSKGKVQ
jgi:TonB family protein